jgi:hypothetical protein
MKDYVRKMSLSLKGGHVMFILKVAIAALLIILPLSAAAQDVSLTQQGPATGYPAYHSLAGKHRIEIGVGLLSKIYSTTTLSDGYTTTRSEADGLLGSISYSHWLEDHVSIQITTGIMDVDAHTTEHGSETFVEASTVTPLLFGVKYQLSRQPVGAAMRPYVSAAVGPYFGFVSDSWSRRGTEVRSYSEAVLGSRIGMGMDLLLGRHFMLGIGAGYHFVSDFSERIGAKKNYSSPDFGISFGVVFGRGRY